MSENLYETHVSLSRHIKNVPDSSLLIKLEDNKWHS